MEGAAGQQRADRARRPTDAADGRPVRRPDNPGVGAAMTEASRTPIVFRSSTGAGYSVVPHHRTLLDLPDGPILRMQVTGALPRGYVAVRPPSDKSAVIVTLRSPGTPYDLRIAGAPIRVRNRADTITAVPAEAESVWQASGGGEQVVLCNFPDPWLARLGLEHDLTPSGSRFPPRIADPMPTIAALATLMRRADAEGAATPGFVEHWAVMVALALLRCPLGKDAPARGLLAPSRLRRVLDFIEANLEGDVSLVTLARVAGLSAFHFARGFRATVGLAPHAYVTRRRIERAQALMRRGGMDLAEVGLAAGFASQSHFTTAFRRATGTTPGSWRKAMLGDLPGKGTGDVSRG